MKKLSIKQGTDKQDVVAVSNEKKNKRQSVPIEANDLREFCFMPPKTATIGQAQALQGWAMDIYMEGFNKSLQRGIK